METARLVAFIREHSLGVEATVVAGGAPQAAVVGLVVNDALELFFDTLESTRKFANLKSNPKIALVIGWDHEQTVQYEGVADVPTGAGLEAFLALYFARFPDGPQRRSWPGIQYVRVRPRWIRYSDFRVDPPVIFERGDF